MTLRRISDYLNEEHYPSLNGLRGISIIIVVLSHLSIPYKQFGFLFIGDLGVSIFFVISGFLITTLCIKEKILTGKLGLKNFYIRRILRIFPLAYLYIFIIYCLNVFLNLDIRDIQFFGASFFIMDFSYFRSHGFTWLLGHFWSLSVEEQFYILFPVVLKLRLNIFSGIVIFIAFILPFLCLLQEFYKPLNEGFFYYFTHYLIKFQSISVGCFFSIASFKKWLDHKYLLSTKVVGNILAIVLISYMRYLEFYSVKSVFINLVISMLTGYIIVTNIVPAKDLFYKVLNTKLLSFIGIISYGIYIWQQIFTSYDARLPHFLVFFPTNVIFIVLVPILSYYFYETYFLRLKHKWQFKSGKENQSSADRSLV